MDLINPCANYKEIYFIYNTINNALIISFNETITHEAVICILYHCGVII
ncbi:hypothetical protein BMETH_483_0 [methanotrophic bacterial endosymbiont of Bathymodiolus sp.]|nr:hypothetical protein BMETH_483_0 [methanotrophic bacterial endosymbiont of Bathymodiolus sp.]